VAVMQVEFIANTPSEQCRMIFVFHDFFPQSGEVLGYSFCIIIIKSMSFCGYRQTHGDGQTTCLRFIQDLLSIMRTPSAYLISSLILEFIHKVAASRPLYEIRFAVT